MRWALVLVVVMSGCVDPGSTECGDGFVCPQGKLCATVDTDHFCVDADQLGCDSDLACTAKAVSSGTCFEGVCLANACGNSRVDIDEACDDGQTADGDGCSADCQSKEVCGNGVIDQVTAEQCDDGIAALSRDGCSSRCSVEALLWSDITPQPIAARTTAVMATDPSTDTVLLFGGYGNTAFLGDTWQWVGQQWRRRNTAAAPSARGDHAMAFDGLRHEFVMFGGKNASLLGDTWIFDGANWIEKHPAASPTPRVGASMAYDAQRQRIVLYGGADLTTGALSDTWEWDGSNWVPGPASASQYSGNALLAYDAARMETVAFVAGTTRIWRNGAWSQPTTNTPPNGVAIAYDGLHNLIVLLSTDGNTYTWNGSNWTPHANGGNPSPRVTTAMTYAPNNVSVLLFGGSTGTDTLGDTWLWDGSAWTQPSQPASSPPPRGGHVMGYDTRTGAILMHGGGDSYDNLPIGDTWSWYEGGWTRLAPSASPIARANHAMSYDSDRGRFVMFGGSDTPLLLLNNTHFQDTWEWNGTTWLDVTPGSGSPSGRRLAAMAYDAGAKQTVLFGGGLGLQGTTYGDTWGWNGTGWSLLAAASSSTPPAREGAGMAYDPILDRIVMFGGLTSWTPPRTVLADTWQWDGTSWTKMSPAVSPPARANPILFYNPDRRTTMLVSGRGQVGGLFDDVWEWNGTTWSQLSTLGITGQRVSGAYDNLEHRLVAFSGFGLIRVFTDTVSLQFTASIEPVERCLSPDLDEDGDLLKGCDDPDCWASCSPLCPPAVSCPASAPRCGDGSCANLERGLCLADCP